MGVKAGMALPVATVFVCRWEVHRGMNRGKAGMALPVATCICMYM